MNNEKLVHSKIGIVSVGLVVARIFILLFVSIVLRIFGGTFQNQQNLGSVFIIFIYVIPPLFTLIGLILGVIGAFNKHSKKLFPILGIVLNGIWLVAEVIWWILLAIILYVGANLVWR